MLEKLLLVNKNLLRQYKYWLVLLSLLVVGYAYQQVDKSSVYVSGVEFVHYGDASLFSLEVGNEVIFDNNVWVLTEQMIHSIYRYYHKHNNDNFIKLVTSQSCVYQLLLSEKRIDNKTMIIGNYLLDLLKKNELVRLTATDILKLSNEEKVTLGVLYNIIGTTTNFNTFDEFGNFTLTTKSRIKSFVNFLPSAYYQHLINYIESDGNEKLLRDYNFFKTKNENVENLFAIKEKQLYSLEDEHRTLKYASDLVDLEIFEAETSILEAELYQSRAYYNDIVQKVNSRSSQFYLINQLFIPIEYKANWSSKFFGLSLLGLLICYIVIFIIIFIKSLDFSELLVDLDLN